MPRRSHTGSVVIAALLLLSALAGCDREDQSKAQRELDRIGEEADQQLDELGDKAQKAWEEAKPELKKGAREAGKAVGEGVEAAGEALQRGGEKLQQEARDTSETTLPDTGRKDTVILKKNR